MDMDDNGYVIPIWKLRGNRRFRLFLGRVSSSNWGWFVRPIAKLGGWFILVCIILRCQGSFLVNHIFSPTFEESHKTQPGCSLHRSCTQCWRLWGRVVLGPAIIWKHRHREVSQLCRHSVTFYLLWREVKSINLQ